MIGHQVNGAMERWVSIVLNDAVDQVLVVRVECRRPFRCFDDRAALLRESDCNKATAVICERESCLSKNSLRVVIAAKVEPVFDFEVQILLRVDQEISEAFT